MQVPKVRIPGITLPKVQLPKLGLPEIKMPEIKVPEIKVPEIKVPEQLATAQQHVVSTAKHMVAQVNDSIDPTRRRTVVLERVAQAEREALKALEDAMARTATVREKLELPFGAGVGKALRSNVEFAVTLARRQADFAKRVVKTLVPAA